MLNNNDERCMSKTVGKLTKHMAASFVHTMSELILPDAQPTLLHQGVVKLAYNCLFYLTSSASMIVVLVALFILSLCKLLV